MTLFKKEKKKQLTIQEHETEFNKAQWLLGSLTYLIEDHTKELNKLNDQLNETIQVMDHHRHWARLLVAKAKKEVNDTIKEGEKNESPLN
jgi:uncharacterized coiled-coil protein SlyX